MSIQNDALVHVRFFSQPDENHARSRAEGRPIFEDKEFVEIRFAANKQTVHVAPAHEQYTWDKDDMGNKVRVTYAEKYPDQYRKFKAGLDQIGDGTPLAELPFLTQAQRSELRALNIHSAETLAALDGQPLRMLGMKGRELKNQAQAYIDKAKGSANVTAVAAENAVLREQIGTLAEQMKELQKARIDEPDDNDIVDEGPWSDFTDEDVKNWIADAGGAKFRGRPSRKTLIAKANELNEALKAKHEGRAV